MCARGPALVLHLGGAASWRDYIQMPNEFLRETPRHCAISRIKGVSEFLTEPFMNHKYFRRIQFVEILYWTCDIMLDLWCTFVEQEISDFITCDYHFISFFTTTDFHALNTVECTGKSCWNHLCPDA